MNLARLLLLNALATGAAGIVLFVAPDRIAGAAGIGSHPDAAFAYYLLGAAELGLATLALLGRTVADPAALRAIVITFIVFHAASGVAGVLAAVQGPGGTVWWNVALRAPMIVLFGYYSLVSASYPRASAPGP